MMNNPLAWGTFLQVVASRNCAPQVLVPSSINTLDASPRNWVRCATRAEAILSKSLSRFFSRRLANISLRPDTNLPLCSPENWVCDARDARISLSVKGLAGLRNKDGGIELDDMLALNNPRTRKGNILEMLKITIGVIAETSCKLVPTEFFVGVKLMTISHWFVATGGCILELWVKTISAKDSEGTFIGVKGFASFIVFLLSVNLLTN